MADVDISGTVETVAGAENVSLLVEATATPAISVVDASTVAEAVTTPVFALKLYRGTSSVTVSLITMDWDFVELYRAHKNNGIALKGIILIPGSGGPDTFSIKDSSDSGSYLYKGAVSAATVIVYPGSFCKPYIDYSECTLTAGHMITFVW